ncbi:Copine-8, partial [Nowakowskiella sp. JEL0078]
MKFAGTLNSTSKAIQPSSHSLLNLTFQCSQLRSSDEFSKSDPQVVVFEYVKERVSPELIPARHGALADRADNAWVRKLGLEASDWRELGRTEINSGRDVVFAEGVDVPFIFEETQILKIVVLDVDVESEKIENQDLLGYFEGKLCSIVTANGKNVWLNLVHPEIKNNGKILISAKEAVENKMNVKFSGRNLDKMDLFGKSDPYFSNMTTVFTSDVIKKSLEPNWLPVTISMQDLCGGHDTNTPLIIEVYDYDKHKYDDLIGSAKTSVAYMLGHVGTELPLLNPKRKKGPVAGALRIGSATLKPVSTFLDYIADGTDMKIYFAIDFSSANGDPSDPNSLHYISPTGELNEYQKAIAAVGPILESYDLDKRFP